MTRSERIDRESQKKYYYRKDKIHIGKKVKTNILYKLIISGKRPFASAIVIKSIDRFWVLLKTNTGIRMKFGKVFIEKYEQKGVL